MWFPYRVFENGRSATHLSNSFPLASIAHLLGVLNLFPLARLSPPAPRDAAGVDIDVALSEGEPIPLLGPHGDLLIGYW